MKRASGRNGVLPFKDGEDVSGWWSLNRWEWPELSRFGQWLADAPAQGADTERLFKTMAGFHTKARNRTSTSKVFQSTVVKYDMKKKYVGSSTNEDGPGQKPHSKNYYVWPDEYKRVAPALPTAVEPALVLAQPTAVEPAPAQPEHPADDHASIDDDNDYIDDALEVEFEDLFSIATTSQKCRA